MKKEGFYVILCIVCVLLAVVVFGVTINKWRSAQYISLLNGKTGKMEKVPISEVYPQMKEINSSIKVEEERYRKMGIPASAMPYHVPTFNVCDNIINRGRIILFTGFLFSGVLLFLAFYTGKKYFRRSYNDNNR